ncbi:hypothetical protein EKO27_g1766 [Xylaria grammica]|uniref:Uncharacterized protein n=1 Tax=Xylaria grammica TaxID=363999 RepID=A0A439DG15_9PEZI|nr:hypothetical protein EKO27_g1766 [Xylaria grammica]
MAPSSKGTNPAPNYTVAMNQVQTQIEAQLRIVRSFMPPRPPAPGPAPAKATPSFSALASSEPTPPASAQTRRQAQKQNEDSLFAENRAEDPNAGRRILRARLLGRKRGAGDGLDGPLRRDESSDEEPGRSGLGRAKKRARREESREEGGTPQPVAEPEVLEPEPEKVVAKDNSSKNGKLEEDGRDINMGDAQGAISLHDASIPNGAEDAPGQKSKKRKRKKKKAKSVKVDGE